MSVRDPRYQPRRAGRRTPRTATALVAVVAVLAFAIPVGAILGGMGGDATPPPTGAAVAGSPHPSALPSGTPGSGPTTPEPTAATPSPTPSLGPSTADIAIVPVTQFRTPIASAGWGDVNAIAAGTKGRFASLALVERDAEPILAVLGTDRAALGARLVTYANAEALADDLAVHRDRLAFVRGSEVGPSVRALGWGDDALFGVDRVETLAAWPLKARLETAEGTPGTAATPPPGGTAASNYDPARAWTMVAGGDILLDRGVALAIQGSKRGSKFPFDGGTVAITGRCKDCSAFGWDLPYTKRTGNTGAVRDLLLNADLSIANFENPAPDKFRFHSKGTVFTANPAYLSGIADAGIDWVSLANNHIGDAGRNGILQTMANLDDVGIAHGGAGKDLDAARTPSILEANGVKVAILAYDAIAATYHAAADKTGSAGLSAKAVVADIAKARAAGADVVIVFPHWGVEYRATPSTSQRTIAHAAIDAGADMVIGNHAHWAAAVESYKGRPIWYALGNFVFDQTWSEPTMEGILLELTFDGSKLVQARMRPHLLLDRAQPNFLDPADDGKIVMDQVFKGSKGLLAW